MNYTQIYRKIYSAIKNDFISHETAHSIAIRITDAITDLRNYTKVNVPDVYEIVGQTISEFWNDNSNTKLGGYDIDDKKV